MRCAAFLFFMIRHIFASLFVLLSLFSSVAQNTDLNSLCPVKRFIDVKSPLGFANTFKGDTIYFTVPNSDDAYFETFKLFEPDTLWLKECPKNKAPEQHKHYKLVNHFRPVPGWGVNAHRQYTPGTTLEKCKFVICGAHTEEVQYLGKFNFILLEDVQSGKLIKWDFTKNENNGLIILSPSIIRHLSLMKDMDFLIDESESGFTLAKCTDVAFSVLVKYKQFHITLDADFNTYKGHRTSHNWNPRFFLKKDKDKLITNNSSQQ